MTIHKLTVGDGYTYLTRHVAGGDVDRERGQDATDYYTAEGNPPGQWLGDGITALGLSAGDDVSEAQMRALFGLGMHPDADRIISDFQAAHITADLTAAQLAAVNEQARRKTALGRAFPIYQALKPYEERVSRRLDNIAQEMNRPATDIEIKKVRREESARQRAGVAGYDVVFAPVKSAALLWALDERAEVRAAVRAAHDEAKTSALGLLERHAAYTRAGKGGVAQIETKGLVAVAFDHYDSRCGDPNLHTHVVLANKIQGVDGKWRSLDATTLYQMTVAASEHYNTVFETALAARLSVRFEPRQGATAGKEPVREIAGIPTEWITLFSKRRSQMEARYDELLRDYRRTHGHDPSRATAHKLARQATLDTRGGKKPPRSLQSMRADWREKITQACGDDTLTVLQRITATPTTVTTNELSGEQIDALAAAIISRVSEARAVWTRWNVRAETERCLRHGGLHFRSSEDLKRLAEQVTGRAVSPAHSILVDAPPMLDEPAVLRRGDGESVFTRHGAARYTSHRILDAEQRLVDAATTPAVHAIPHATVTSRLEVFEARHGCVLDAGQRELVAGFACADTRIAAGIGAAGTGKTTAMKALRHVVEACGRRLIPLATSAAAAAVLGNDIGAPAENLHKFLWEHHHGNEATALTCGHQVPAKKSWFQVRPGDIILVDEAGMAGTLLLDRLLTIAERHGASVRLLGDYRQLGAVESGGALRLIAHDAGASELSVLHRFTNPGEAAASTSIRVGDTAGLDFYQTQGRIAGGSRQAMTDAVYDAWRADMRAGRISLMIAATNRDITALSARARAERVAVGKVEPSGVTLADHNLAGKGDWIVTRHNQRTLTTHRGRDFVKNGDAWTVEHRYRDGRLKVRHQEHGGRIVLPADYVAAHVQLHYATTTHRAQGGTVDTAHVLVDDQLTRENLYVALTRGRHTNHAYVATHELLPLDEDQRMNRPRHDPDARASRETLEQIIGRDGTALSATETIRRSQQHAASLATLVPTYLHALERASTAGYQQLIGTMFDPATAELLTGDPAFSAVVRAMHRGETAGWQPEQLLATAARRGPLTHADSAAELLAWRINTTIREHRAPVHLVQPTRDEAARYATLTSAVTGLPATALDPERALRTPAAMTIDPQLTAPRDRHHYQSIIVGVLGSRLTIRAANETAWPALAASVRRAEHAGHNPADLLQHALRQREMSTADSISEVLAWRIGRHLDHHRAAEPGDHAESWTQLAWTVKAAEQQGLNVGELLADVHRPAVIVDLARYLQAVIPAKASTADTAAVITPWLPNAAAARDPDHSVYLAQAADQMAGRIQDLALDAAARRPAWTTVFGDQPANPATRDTWLTHLGIAAAYRDQHQITDDTAEQPLGPYIDTGRAGHHAYWKAAEAVIAAHHLTHRQPQQPEADHLTHRIAVDIYHSLTPLQRRQVTDAMAQRLGPPWLGDADDDASAVQPVHATQFVNLLREHGHLAASASADGAHPRELVAREVERIAGTAAEARGTYHTPALPTVPELQPPTTLPQGRPGAQIGP